jgi:hypothetical protein
VAAAELIAGIIADTMSRQTAATPLRRSRRWRRGGGGEAGTGIA